MQELNKQLATANTAENSASTGATDEAQNLLLDAIARGMVEVSGRRFMAGSDSNDLPQSQAYARYQAKNSFAVTNRVHESKTLDPLALLLIRHLDGKTAKETLAEIVAAALKAGDIKLEQGEQTVSDANISNEMRQELVNEALKNLADSMLLVNNNS